MHVSPTRSGRSRTWVCRRLQRSALFVLCSKCVSDVDRLEQTKSSILPELLELTNDEESLVRLAGIETVVRILTLLDEGSKNKPLIP